MWRTGLVAPRHVGSSQTRARTRVPCIGRRILNHCATREAHVCCFLTCTSLLFKHHQGDTLQSILRTTQRPYQNKNSDSTGGGIGNKLPSDRDAWAGAPPPWRITAPRDKERKGQGWPETRYWEGS